MGEIEKVENANSEIPLLRADTRPSPRPPGAPAHAPWTKETRPVSPGAPKGLGMRKRIKARLETEPGLADAIMDALFKQATSSNPLAAIQFVTESVDGKQTQTIAVEQAVKQYQVGLSPDDL
jgi:hypothetical protein